MSTTTADVEIPQEVWDRADRALRFWTEHHEELLRKYPEQYVAMKDDAIIAARTSLRALCDDIESRGLDITHDVACKFIAPAPPAPPATRISTAHVEIPQEVWDRADQEIRFWNEHHEALLRKYPEQYVAMKDDEIIAAHSTLGGLCDDIESRGLDITRDVCCKFITSAWNTFNF